MYKDLKTTIAHRKNTLLLAGLLITILAIGSFLVWKSLPPSVDLSRGQSAACGEAIIQRYNTAIKATTSVKYEKNLAAVATEIVGLPGQTKDQNCAYMLYVGAVGKSDVANARNYVDAFRVLQEKGKKLDDRILDPLNLQQMEDRVRALESADGTTTAGGRG
ncbi:hypothetical protein H7Y40_02570 [Pedobacter sp.]|nr:hypothetical protein [Candidatus Saccharibacteria bacterium]